LILTGSGDRTARLWDASVTAVAFSDTGDAVLTKTEKGIVRRWDRPAEPTGPDEQFVLWAKVAIGAEIDANGNVRGLDASAWNHKRARLRALGGPPWPEALSGTDWNRHRFFRASKGARNGS
jgi:hypothetical protein